MNALMMETELTLTTFANRAHRPKEEKATRSVLGAKRVTAGTGRLTCSSPQARIGCLPPSC